MLNGLITKRPALRYIWQRSKKSRTFEYKKNVFPKTCSMRKRLLLTFALVAVAVCSLHAQQGPRFRFGLTASPALSWFSPETRNYLSEGPVLGIAYGLLGEYHLGDHYAISTNFLISHFGGKLSYIVLEPGYGVVAREREYRLRYFEAPITFKLQSSEIGYFTYFGRIGFSPGFNLKATGLDSFTQNQTGITLERDIKGEIPLVRLAFVIGAGAEYALGARTRLVGGIMYNNGFTNNLKGRNEAMENAFQSATSSYFSLNVGVMF
jgi:hypothetical protein